MRFSGVLIALRAATSATTRDGCGNCVSMHNLAIASTTHRLARRSLPLLCGGDKRSQQADIETARKYWKDYKGRAA